MKINFKRMLLAWLLLNVTMFAVGFVLTSHWPGRLSVTIDAASPVNISSNGGKMFVFNGKGRQTARTYVPTDFNHGVFALKQCSGEKLNGIVGAEYRTRFFIDRQWRDRAFDTTGTLSLDLSDSTIGIARPVLMLILVLEFLFLWLAHAASRLSNVKVISGHPAVHGSVVALAFSCFFVLVVPLQTYFGSREAFDCTVGELLVESIPNIGLIFLVALLVVQGCRRLFNLNLLPLLVAIVAWEYLECGILSFDLPPLDGEIDFYNDVWRGTWPMLIWGIVMVVAWVMRRYANWMALVFFVMSVASVFDAKRDMPLTFKSDIIQSFASKEAVVKSCVHSPRKNVVIYLVDCISTPCALDVLRQAPEIARAFDGFTCLTNNIGMYGFTFESVAGFATGKYLDDPSKRDEYAFGVFTGKSFVKPYLDHGAEVFMTPGSFNYGYSSRITAGSGLEINTPKEDSALNRRMVGQQQWNLREIARFRMMPFLLKKWAYKYTVAGWDVGDQASLESWAHSIIAEAPILNDCGLTLQYWHTEGAHPPMCVDRNGIDIGVAGTGYEAKFNKTWYALSTVAKQMQHLRDRGLYDNSYIIVMADHGGPPSDPSCRDCGYNMLQWNRDIKPSFLIGRSQPILWIKPLKTHGEIAYSAVPTSHANIHDLVVSLVDRDVTTSESLSILRSDVRVFRADDYESFYDCVVDAGGRPTYRKVDGIMNNGKLVPVQLSHKYMFTTEHRDVFRTSQIGFKSGSGWTTTGSSLQFLVPDKEREYDVELSLSWFISDVVRTDGMHTLGVEDAKSKRQMFIPDELPWSKTVKLSLKVTPDDSGYVCLKMLGYSEARIYSLTVR